MSTELLGTTIITGGASGLGAATATAVAAAGGTPLVLDRAPWPGDHDGRLVDLADTRAAEAAVQELIDGAPEGVDAVVCAAGTDACGELMEVAAEDWERVILVNLLGTAAVVRAALPHLGDRGGRIVTVASTLGQRALPAATAYCASKFGVVGFTRALAAEVEGRVGVTLLMPGGMATSFFDGREERYRPGPDARLADPAAVADAIVFALGRPRDAAVREMLVCPDTEPSWP